MDKMPLLKTIVLRVLKPLVYLLIKNEVSHSEFSEMAKTAYVEVAQSRFAIPQKKMTVSRVAVLSGLSRKEVVRLSKEGNKSPEPKVTQSRAARVVTGWLNDPDFLLNSKPKDLSLRGENSFTTLVERYSGDITSGAILDELLRTEIVSLVDEQYIKLEQFGYIPDKNEIEQIDILSVCAQDLLNTGIHNLNNKKDHARFQRQLIHRKVSEEVAEKFTALCKEKSLDLLLDLDNWLKNQKVQSDSAKAKSRIGLGIYHFED